MNLEISEKASLHPLPSFWKDRGNASIFRRPWCYRHALFNSNVWML